MDVLNSQPIASSRMYNVSPQVERLWNDLFDWLAQSSGIPLMVLPHRAPAPLSELWSNPNMAAVLMCGYPFAKLPLESRPTPIAAPVSSAAWAGAQPCYATHLVALKGPGPNWESVAGARLGWTVRDSQSGYHAPRFYLSSLGESVRPKACIGPLLNPNGIIDALLTGQIDIGPIDAYSYQLLEMHNPDITRNLHILATTQRAPAPLLVASPQQPNELIAALRHTLTTAHKSERGCAALRALGLLAFIVPDISHYEILKERALSADRCLGDTW